MPFRSIVLTPALTLLVYYLMAIYCSWDYFRKLRRGGFVVSIFAAPVSILRPVRGVDPRLVCSPRAHFLKIVSRLLKANGTGGGG